jgi:GT2 family glycosyltransferase
VTTGTAAETLPGPGPSEQAGLVSVVLIFLNEERYLGEAIESVRSQDYPHWELLLVDDGSTDRSPDIAQSYAARDERIRLLAHPARENRGMSASRNLGLQQARGEYVAFLDADDIYLPRRLGRHVEVLEAHPTVAVTASGYLRCFSGDSGAMDLRAVVSPRPFFFAGDVVWEPPLGLAVVTQVPFMNLGTFSITARRRVALEAGGFEDSFRAMYEDQVFATKMLGRYRTYFIHAYLACYRHHGASVTRRAKAPKPSPTGPAVTDTQRFLEWQLGYLQAHGISDPLIIEPILARQRRAARPAGGVATATARVAAILRSLLERILPRSWHRQLLRLDYQLDCLRGRRAYLRLTRILAARGRSGLLEGRAA